MTHPFGTPAGPRGERAQMSDLHLPSSRYVLPQCEERTSYGFKRIDPYDKLFEERIIFLGTPIDDDVANDVMAQLLMPRVDDPDRDIQIYINSPGRLVHRADGDLRHDAVRPARRSRPSAWARRPRPRRSSWRRARRASGSRCPTAGS